MCGLLSIGEIAVRPRLPWGRTSLGRGWGTLLTQREALIEFSSLEGWGKRRTFWPGGPGSCGSLDT